MAQLIMIAAVAAVAGLLVGALSAAWFGGRRFKRQMAEVGGEIVRLRAIAESKLSGDDPDLNGLLQNLHEAADKAYRAIEALENQAELTKRKSAGGKEVIAASRQVLRMMEELGAEIPGAARAMAVQPVKAAPALAQRAKEPPLKAAPISGNSHGHANGRDTHGHAH